jgi:hypothetical protein
MYQVYLQCIHGEYPIAVWEGPWVVAGCLCYDILFSMDPSHRHMGQALLRLVTTKGMVYSLIGLDTMYHVTLCCVHVTATQGP